MVVLNLQIDDSAKVPKYLPAPVIAYSDDYDFIEQYCNY
jgi:hypothetical protein